MGNWTELAEDITGNGLFTDAGDEMQPRTHNAVNEIVDLTEGEDPVTRSGGEDHDLTHDAAGNLELNDDQSAGDADWRYTHDAWNRLVKVEHDDDAGGWDVRAEYDYNGLNWRTLARADMSATPDGVLDREKAMYYDQSWRLLEERINDDADQNSVVDRVCQQLWGARYIDDAVLRREDANADGDYIDSGDKEWNYITDAQFSVIALISDSDSLVERVAYTPYGVARHQRAYDVDGDGDADSTDNNILQGATYGKSIGHADYNVDADFNRDGVVNPTDLLAFLSNQAGALDPGQISAVDNPIGYDGYVFNDELGPGYDLYTVRHRTLSPDMGRWMERDPGGYNRTLNLYNYSSLSPLVRRDPLGLCDNSDDDDPRDDDECCANARDELGIPSDVRGQTICCDGRAVACVYAPFGPGGEPCNKPGAGCSPKDSISAKCTQKHEEHHRDNHVGSCGDGIHEPFPKPGWEDPRRRECDAQTVSIECLFDGGLFDCPTAECADAIFSEMCKRCAAVENDCGGFVTTPAVCDGCS